MTVVCRCLGDGTKEQIFYWLSHRKSQLTGSHVTLLSDYDRDAGLHILTGDMLGWYIKVEEDKACVHHFQLSFRKERRGHSTITMAIGLPKCK